MVDASLFESRCMQSQGLTLQDGFDLNHDAGECYELRVFRFLILNALSHAKLVHLRI